MGFQKENLGKKETNVLQQYTPFHCKCTGQLESTGDHEIVLQFIVIFSALSSHDRICKIKKQKGKITWAFAMYQRSTRHPLDLLNKCLTSIKQREGF